MNYAFIKKNRESLMLVGSAVSLAMFKYFEYLQIVKNKANLSRVMKYIQDKTLLDCSMLKDPIVVEIALDNIKSKTEDINLTQSVLSSKALKTLFNRIKEQKIKSIDLTGVILDSNALETLAIEMKNLQPSATECTLTFDICQAVLPDISYNSPLLGLWKFGTTLF